MIARASLLACCLFWMAYESHFSPQFFFRTVQASVVEMQAGLDTFMSRDMTPTLQQAETRTALATQTQ